jgi:hypothetical protein
MPGGPWGRDGRVMRGAALSGSQVAGWKASQGGWGAMRRRDHRCGRAVDGESATGPAAGGGPIVAPWWVVWAVRL